jgi:hypothetical protein
MYWHDWAQNWDLRKSDWSSVNAWIRGHPILKPQFMLLYPGLRSYRGIVTATQECSRSQKNWIRMGSQGVVLWLSAKLWAYVHFHQYLMVLVIHQSHQPCPLTLLPSSGWIIIPAVSISKYFNKFSHSSQSSLIQMSSPVRNYIDYHASSIRDTCLCIFVFFTFIRTSNTLTTAYNTRLIKLQHYIFLHFASSLGKPMLSNLLTNNAS